MNIEKADESLVTLGVMLSKIPTRWRPPYEVRINGRRCVHIDDSIGVPREEGLTKVINEIALDACHIAIPSRREDWEPDQWNLKEFVEERKYCSWSLFKPNMMGVVNSSFGLTAYDKGTFDASVGTRCILTLEDGKKPVEGMVTKLYRGSVVWIEKKSKPYQFMRRIAG